MPHDSRIHEQRWRHHGPWVTSRDTDECWFARLPIRVPLNLRRVLRRVQPSDCAGAIARRCHGHGAVSRGLPRNAGARRATTTTRRRRALDTGDIAARTRRVARVQFLQFTSRNRRKPLVCRYILTYCRRVERRKKPPRTKKIHLVGWFVGCLVDQRGQENEFTTKFR